METKMQIENSSIQLSFGLGVIPETTLGDILIQEKKKETEKIDKKMNAFEQTLKSRKNLH